MNPSMSTRPLMNLKSSGKARSLRKVMDGSSSSVGSSFGSHGSTLMAIALTGLQFFRLTAKFRHQQRPILDWAIGAWLALRMAMPFKALVVSIVSLSTRATAKPSMQARLLVDYGNQPTMGGPGQRTPINYPTLASAPWSLTPYILTPCTSAPVTVTQEIPTQPAS